MICFGGLHRTTQTTFGITPPLTDSRITQTPAFPPFVLPTIGIHSVLWVKSRMSDGKTIPRRTSGIRPGADGVASRLPALHRFGLGDCSLRRWPQPWRVILARTPTTV